MSGVSFVDGGFFTMHKVPNTNVFIIIKNSRQSTYHSCYCEIIEVRLPEHDHEHTLILFTVYVFERRPCLFLEESGTPHCTFHDCECPCHAPARYDYCENQLPPKMFVCISNYQFMGWGYDFWTYFRNQFESVH